VRARAVSWYAARFPIEASAKLLERAGDRARMKLVGGGRSFTRASMPGELNRSRRSRR
jgi:hypothetical protein